MQSSSTSIRLRSSNLREALCSYLSVRCTRALTRRSSRPAADFGRALGTQRSAAGWLNGRVVIPKNRRIDCDILAGYD
jgi:hypothetical protein